MALLSLLAQAAAGTATEIWFYPVDDFPHVFVPDALLCFLAAEGK